MKLRAVSAHAFIGGIASIDSDIHDQAPHDNLESLNFSLLVCDVPHFHPSQVVELDYGEMCAEEARAFYSRN